MIIYYILFYLFFLFLSVVFCYFFKIKTKNLNISCYFRKSISKLFNEITVNIHFGVYVMSNQNVLKTGTTTIGILAKDGVVLATDKRATAGSMIVDKRAEKLHKITDNIALTIAGSVSDAQKIISWLKSELQLIRLKNMRDNDAVEAAHFLANVVYSKIREPSMIESISQFILAGKSVEGFKLFDIFPDGSITDIQDYVSSGSGSVFAYGVLETNYDKNITVKDAVKLAIKGVYAAMQRDTYSGNGIDVLYVDDSGVNFLTKDEVNKILKSFE